jgi:tripartite-type tricarboxylate transporter receptor subunit TctC
LPVTTVGDLLKLAKRRPKELNFASQGNGSVGHLSGAMLKVMGGADITHVPYKGASPAITATISGETQILFDSPFSAMPHVRSKKVRALAVSSTKRMVIAPEIPTVAESGVPGFEAGIWYSLLAPARTPRHVVDRLYRESANALRAGDFRDMFVAQGAEIIASSPEEFAAYLKNDSARWAKIIKSAGVRAD